jgi:hypothetical protein
MMMGGLKRFFQVFLVLDPQLFVLSFTSKVIQREKETKREEGGVS